MIPSSALPLIVTSLAALALLAAYVRLRIRYGELKASLKAQEAFEQTFKALSYDALEQSNRSFLALAKETLGSYQAEAKGALDKKQEAFASLVAPVKESLAKLDSGMRELEKERKGESSMLTTHLAALKAETSSLARALRAPTARGRWGEIQLRRVVELAGMVNHCDFSEQVHDGSMRPDLIVNLPGEKQVIVDAKTPCDAYLEATHATDDDVRIKLLQQHARSLRAHVQTLGKRAYWEKFQPTPEFVVLFIPSDALFTAALEYDPTLIELGADHGVIIATPTTLIGLLRAIAYGWKQEGLSRHAQEISELGHELYKRLADVSRHWAKVGRSLSSSVDAYNKAVGSLESRVLVTARKFKELGSSRGDDVEALEPIERIPRPLTAPELTQEE
jgi:DNA recombination protein RmuC